MIAAASPGLECAGDSYRLKNHDLGRIPTPIEDGP